MFEVGPFVVDYVNIWRDVLMLSVKNARDEKVLSYGRNGGDLISIISHLLDTKYLILVAARNKMNIRS